ncbi:zinc-dependent peptidase [Alcaligenaceae bacterium]|nr:zinc-dependent peptidase [Alcaligenaceae bacterium]
MFRWLAGRGARPSRVAETLTRISPSAWQGARGSLAFLNGLDEREDEALRARAAWLLASKSFSGAAGMALDDDIMLSIAIQAALPILELDPVLYEGWTEIIVYPGGFVIPRTEVDDSGVVHEYIQEAAGEAWDGGPVILSWEDSCPGVPQTANVVIHEFAHKLDLYGGEADGMPILDAHPQLRPRQWRRILASTFECFEQMVTEVEDAIPHYVDPESEEADPWYGSLPLDPYAATDTAEFFAVSSEAFFVDPWPLAQAFPDWYGLLQAYYRQDPLRRLMGRGWRKGSDPAL